MVTEPRKQMRESRCACLWRSRFLAGRRAASFLRRGLPFTSADYIHVLSEPCWIVTHHTALKPNLWWIPGDKVKAFDPLPHTLRCSSRRSSSDAALSFKPLSFGSDKSSPFGRFAQVVFPYLP